MNALEWWLRRRLAGWAYPEIGRLDQALADAAKSHAAQLAAERKRTRDALIEVATYRGLARLHEATLRKIDAQRLEAVHAECPPWSPVRDELEAAARHTDADLRGGR